MRPTDPECVGDAFEAFVADALPVEPHIHVAVVAVFAGIIRPDVQPPAAAREYLAQKTHVGVFAHGPVIAALPQEKPPVLRLLAVGGHNDARFARLRIREKAERQAHGQRNVVEVEIERPRNNLPVADNLDFSGKNVEVRFLEVAGGVNRAAHVQVVVRILENPVALHEAFALRGDDPANDGLLAGDVVADAFGFVFLAAIGEYRRSDHSARRVLHTGGIHNARVPVYFNVGRRDGDVAVVNVGIAVEPGYFAIHVEHNRIAGVVFDGCFYFTAAPCRIHLCALGLRGVAAQRVKPVCAWRNPHTVASNLCVASRDNARNKAAE